MNFLMINVIKSCVSLACLSGSIALLLGFKVGQLPGVKRTPIQDCRFLWFCLKRSLIPGWNVYQMVRWIWLMGFAPQEEVLAYVHQVD